MKEIYEQNKKLIIALGIIIAMVCIFYVINIITGESNVNKYIKNKNYVFTIESSGTSKLPFINIDSEEVKKINEELKKEYHEIILYSNSYMKYEYNIKEDNLSILIEKGIKKEDDDFLEIKYETYNISVKDKKIKDYNQVLKENNLNINSLKNVIETNLKDQYDKEVNQGYVVYQECDYNCFLEYREYTSVENNLKIYVDNEKVYGYLNLRSSSLYYLPNDYPEIKRIFELN